MKKVKKAIGVLIAILIVSVTAAMLLQQGPEEITFYIYEKGKGGNKPPWAGGGKNDPGEGYKIIAKWDTPVNYAYTEGPGLSDIDVGKALQDAGQEWENHAKINLIGTVTWIPDADFERDNNNEVSFGDWLEPRVIAVCRMWVTRGKPSTRRIVEFDIMFDTDYTWGDAAVEPSVMDLQNIGAHELGHGIAGLDDIYDEYWSELTMYGYSEYGETKKRTLEQGDIDGVQANYAS